jgi:hypothetical protein
VNPADDFDSPPGDDVGSGWLDDLFAQVRSRATAEELSSQTNVVAAMLRTITQPQTVVDIDTRRRHGISKVAVRTAIVAAALFVGTSTVAATGNLPDPAQSAVARATAHLGVDIPDPAEHHTAPTTAPTATELASAEPPTQVPITDPPATDVPATDASALQPLSIPTSTAPPDPASTDSTTTAPPASATSTVSAPDAGMPATTDAPDAAPPETDQRGPDLSGPAKQGLCRAWAAHDGSDADEHSQAMRNLEAAADAAGQTVAEFCAGTVGTDPSTTSVDDQLESENNEKKSDESDKEKSEKDKKDKEEDTEKPEG